MTPYVFVVIVTFACQGNYYFKLDDSYPTKDEAIDYYREEKLKKDTNVSESHYDLSDDSDHAECIITTIKTGKRTKAKDDALKNKKPEIVVPEVKEPDEEPSKEEPVIEVPADAKPSETPQPPEASHD